MASVVLPPPVSGESQNCALEVSDWPAMQRGLVPGEAGELWCHGLLFTPPPTTRVRRGLRAPFHLLSCWLRFLCHSTSGAPFLSCLKENLCR